MGHPHSQGVPQASVRNGGIAARRSGPEPNARSLVQVHASGSPRGVTHPERIVDASTGFTKGQVAEYYASAYVLMRKHLDARPVSLVRAPSGVRGPLFFQRHASADELPGLEQVDPGLYPGHEPLLIVPSKAGLMSAVQMNTVEFHTWNATTHAMDRPDRMLFDLDPGEGVVWSDVLDGAARVHTLLEQLGLKSFLKTSGGKGLHVVVPLQPVHDWDTIRLLSKSIVARLSKLSPEYFVLKSGPKNRVGRIFIDYLRNGLSATTVCAWSVRARAGMGVSVPVAWHELPELTSGAHWTLGSVTPRLKVGNAPWKAYSSSPQNVAAALNLLNIEPGDIYE